MKFSQKTTRELKEFHKKEKPKIASRLAEFVKVYRLGTDNDVFAELVFCLLTPQSKAKSCWSAVNDLVSKKLLLKGNASQISKELRKKTRFHNNKAKYVVEARELFNKNGKLKLKSKLEEFNDIHELREWLVKNVKGMGYKEAGHFLRNIGLSKNIAILDRHILKNLKNLEVIRKIPAVLNKKTYFEIEKKMLDFSKKIGIPEDHLDLLFWRKETGEIFK